MLGDINPQTIKITSQAVVYPGRDHVTTLNIKRFNGRSYSAVDTSLLTRVVLAFPQTDPVIAYDTATAPAGTITWVGSEITIDLSDFSMPASVLATYLIAYDAEHPNGQVLVDDNDSVLEFDFRNVSATGIVQPPVIELVSEAPIDGETYGRKDGAWVSLAAVVAGVSSVNGQTGIVVLDADDVGAEWPLTAGANITIDRTDPTAPVINATGGGGGAVDSVNGQTGVVVLDAADVGADPTGTAAAEAEDARFQSTGLISGGQLSINVDTTKFDVSELTAVFVDYTDPAKSVATVATFGPLTAITVPNLATALVSYVGINSAGTIVQQTSKFTNTQRRSIVSLGVVIHSNNLNLNAVNTLVAPTRQLLNQFGDGIRAIGQLNLSGNVYGPIGATMQIQRTAGELFSPGANFHVNPDDPHAASLPLVSPVTFRYRLSNSTEYADRSTIDPANYDNAGVLTAVPANRYTVQLISVFQSGITRLQYGQALYNTMSDAVNAAQSQGMEIEQNILENGVIRGYLAVKGDATALNNATQAVFITLSKFSAFATVSPITLATTDELAEGAINLYFTATRVRQTLLTGLSTAVSTAVTAADTVLDAFGKIVARLALKEQILTAGTNITIDRTDPEAPVISATGGSGGREMLTANRTYYVRTDGSDSNNGLTDSAGGAFLTIQHAIDTAELLDQSGYSVTIQVGDGTWTAPVVLKDPVGSGSLTLRGNTGSPASCLISVTSATALTFSRRTWLVEGFELRTTTAGNCVAAPAGTLGSIGVVRFGACAGRHVAAFEGKITMAAGYTISGGAYAHWLVQGAGSSITCNNRTVTLSGTPAFTIFAEATSLGAMILFGNTFSGSATGKRYDVLLNAVVNTFGAGATHLPGNVAGTNATGGQYA